MLQEEAEGGLYAGFFDPRRIFIHICQPPMAFVDENDRLKPATSKGWGLLLHEYFHYLQALSSPVTITVFNNWFSAQTDAAKIFSSSGKSSFAEAVAANSSLQTLVDGINTVYAEMHLAYDIRIPLVPVSNGRVAWAFFDKELEYPGSGVKFQAKHIVVPDDAGKLFEVPLIPSAFAEGMSKALQLFIETDWRWSDQLLKDYPVKAPAVFYSVIARWVRTHFKDADPFWTTIAICDACLCSYDPGHVFEVVSHYLRENKPALRTHQDAISVRRELQNLFPIKSDLLRALGRLNDLDLQLSPAGPKEAAYDMRRVIARMKMALTARLAVPEHFMFPGSAQDMFWHFVGIHGSPVIAIGETKEQEIMIDPAHDEDFTRSCLLLMSIFHIVERALDGTSAGPCPYLPNQCTATKGTYCTDDPLAAPIRNGSGCVMAYAALTLSLSEPPAQ